jgi:hypothetical protein
MRNTDTTRAASMQGRSTTKKLKWKTTQNGNRRLSYYGLTTTVFPNTRRGGWTVSVKENEAQPTYSNHATEEEACTAAEETFLKLKGSGAFRPPPPLSLREILEDVDLSGDIPTELADVVVELDARLGFHIVKEC